MRESSSPVARLSSMNAITARSRPVFGRSLGSVVNVVYKSGSNNFHGSGYEFLRDSSLDSQNYFQKLYPGASQNLRILARSDVFPPTVVAYKKGALEWV